MIFFIKYKKRFTTFWQRYAFVTSRSEQSNISINSNEIRSSTKQNLMTVQDFFGLDFSTLFFGHWYTSILWKKRYKNTFQPHLMNEGCKFSSNCDFNGCELMHFLWSNIAMTFFFLGLNRFILNLNSKGQTIKNSQMYTTSPNLFAEGSISIYALKKAYF